jgi:hypothetical protein
MFPGQMRPLIILALLFMSIDGYTCSCGHVGITKNKNEMDFVFKGRVREVKETVTQEFEPNTNNQIEYRLTKYTFDIIRNYKGLKDKKTFDILTGMTDCEISFAKGKKYIVYAYTDNKKLHYRLREQEIEPYSTTHLCTRTKKTNAVTFWESFILWLT